MGSWKESVSVTLEAEGLVFRFSGRAGDEGRALVRKRSERAVKRPVHSRGWRAAWI